jgi:negative regulator of sigma-B (phosphoserine phosphatase)
MTGPSPLDWSVAARALAGEDTSGDRAVVVVAGEWAVAAAIDGIGHGARAAMAAETASDVITGSPERDVVSIVEQCHAALRATRGAAMSVASFDCTTDVMTWAGIGNVEGRLLRGGQPSPPAESLLLRSGVAGHELPHLTASEVGVRRGDVLIFATDGIRRDFADHLTTSGSTRDLAERLLERHATQADDALVLVARYMGAKS